MIFNGLLASLILSCGAAQGMEQPIPGTEQFKLIVQAIYAIPANIIAQLDRELADTINHTQRLNQVEFINRALTIPRFVQEGLPRLARISFADLQLALTQIRQRPREEIIWLLNTIPINHPTYELMYNWLMLAIERQNSQARKELLEAKLRTMHRAQMSALGVGIAIVCYSFYNHPYLTLAAMTSGAVTANVVSYCSSTYTTSKDTCKWMTGNYTLHDAVKSGHLNRVQYLIEVKKVSPHTLDANGKTAWFYANNEEIKKYTRTLAAQKADNECMVCKDIINNVEQFDVASPTGNCIHFVCKDCKINLNRNCPLCKR